MSIESAEDLAGMEWAGRVTRAVLNAMKDAVQPGISTRELDDIGSSVMRNLGAGRLQSWFMAFPDKTASV